MISIEVFRDNPGKIKDSQKRRGADPELVDNVIELDTEWREKLQKLEELQQKRNTVGDEIAELKKSGESAEEKIETMQSLKEDIQGLEKDVKKIRDRRDEQRYKVANLLAEDVPPGEGEEDNPELRSMDSGKR